jgi:hypothetical protein
MHDSADGRLRYTQPFCRAPHVLLLEDRHGDGELRTDRSQPFNIWIKHIRKFIGLINAECGIVTLTDRTHRKKGNHHDRRQEELSQGEDTDDVNPNGQVSVTRCPCRA